VGESPAQVWLTLVDQADEEDRRLTLEAPVTKPDDYLVFRAEMHLVIAFSACLQDILPINGRARHPTEAHFQVLSGPLKGADRRSCYSQGKAQQPAGPSRVIHPA